MLGYRVTNVVGSTRPGAAVILDGVLYTCCGSHIKKIEVGSDRAVIFSSELEENVRQLAISKCKTLLLVVGKTAGIMFDTRKQVICQRFRYKSEIHAVSFSHSTRYVAIAIDRTVEVWNLQQTGAADRLSLALRSRDMGCSTSLLSLSWSSDDAYLAIASSDRACRIIGLFEQPTFFDFVARAKLLAVHICNEPAKMLSVLTNGEVIKFNFASDGSNTVVRTIPLTSTMLCAAFDASASMICIGASDGFTIHDMVTGVILATVNMDFPVCDSVKCKFDPVSKFVLLSCDESGELCLWDWQSDSLIYKSNNELSKIGAAALSEDGTLLVTGSEAALVKVWRLPLGTCSMTFTQHTGPITDVVFFCHSDAFVSSSLDGTARAVDLIRCKNFRTFICPDGQGITHLSIDQSDNIICGAAEKSHNILVWSMSSGQLLDILVGHEAPVTSLQICPQNMYIISCSWDKTTRVWDLNGSKRELDSFSHSAEITTAILSHNGKMLASLSRNNRIHMWHVLEGTIHGSIDIPNSSTSHNSHSSRLSFIQSDTMLAYLDSSCALRVYDVQSCSLIKRLRLHVDDSSVNHTGTLSSTNNGLILGVTLSNQVHILDNCIMNARPTMIGEEVDEQSIHLAVKQGLYSYALKLAARLANPALFTAVLHTLPASHVNKIARDLSPDASDDFFSGLNHGLSSSPHIESVLFLLREICRQQSAAFFQGCSKLKTVALQLGVAQSSITFLAEKNHAVIEFICTTQNC